MYPKTQLHLNSKQSGQLVVALVAFSVAQQVAEKVKLRKHTKRAKFEHVLIEKDPKTGLVTVLTVEKDGKAMQYSWTPKR